MLFKSIAVAAAAVAVSACPIEPKSVEVEARSDFITVPVKQVSNIHSMKNLVAKGRARLQQRTIGNVFAGNSSSTGAITNDDVSYVAAVTIGGKSYSLIVDTGSSNLWCGAQGSCEPSGTGKTTGDSVTVSYGSGSFSGTEYTDAVTFGGVTVSAQSVGAASKATGFSGVDGIIGFGPVDLTQQTVSNMNTVPTFMDNLKSTGAISTEVLGVSFRPESGGDTDDTNGELTLGGTDSTKYTGALTYFPKLASGAVAPYWGIEIASMKYGSTVLGSNVAGIVDTGTTLIYTPAAVYNAFLKAAGGTTDSASGLASFTTAPTQNFDFTFGSTTYSLTPAQYLVPQAQYSFYGLTAGKSYSFIASGGSSAPNMIVGQKFLENYYSVFDTTNSRIGFATAA